MQLMFIFYSYLFTLEQWNAILNDLTLGLQFHLWRKFKDWRIHSGIIQVKNLNHLKYSLFNVSFL